MSFSFDRVTTGTFNFVSFIWNSNPIGATIASGSLLFPAAYAVISARMQFFIQVRIISTSQLINGILRILQKLLKYFSGIKISVSFLTTLFAS